MKKTLGTGYKKVMLLTIITKNAPIQAPASACMHARAHTHKNVSKSTRAETGMRV
jgi:hypothetical protein